MTEPTVQCEGCNEEVPESKAKMDRLPACEGRVILAWCPECAEKPRREQVL